MEGIQEIVIGFILGDTRLLAHVKTDTVPTGRETRALSNRFGLKTPDQYFISTIISMVAINYHYDYFYFVRLSLVLLIFILL